MAIMWADFRRSPLIIMIPRQRTMWWSLLKKLQGNLSPECLTFIVWVYLRAAVKSKNYRNMKLKSSDRNKKTKTYSQLPEETRQTWSTKLATTFYCTDANHPSVWKLTRTLSKTSSIWSALILTRVVQLFFPMYYPKFWVQTPNLNVFQVSWLRKLCWADKTPWLDTRDCSTQLI